MPAARTRRTGPSPDPTAPAAAGSSSATTAPAPLASDAAPAAATTRSHAERSARDPTPPQPGAVARAVIALVSVQLAGSGPPPPGRGQHRRDIVQDRGEHGHVRDVGRRHDRGQRKPAPLAGELDLGPRLAAIDWICANVVPRVWRAHWPSPRSRATSPTGPPDQAGPAPPDGAARTPRPWPTRSTGAMPSPASHSQVPGLAGAATGSRCGPCRRSRRNSCDPEPFAVGRHTRGEVRQAAGVRPSAIACREQGPQQGSS
jgi:hypothetical protein